MSVQPLAPNSRMNSHRGDRSERTDKEKDANGPTTHPYASATPTPTTPAAGVPLGATYQRTTSNSPLPPLPGGVDESGARVTAAPSSSQGALGVYPNGTASPPTLSRGMSVPRMDGLGYAGQNVAGGQHDDEPPKRGLLSILCCR